jgi:Gas vesicle synthesis protein GvpL/GvpF
MSETEPTTQSQPATPPDKGDRQVYVYGIVPAADADKLPHTVGLDESAGEVRPVVADDLAAIVSDLEPGHTPGRLKDLDAHRRVLNETVQRTTTIPLRFGHVLDDDDAVREALLARYRDVLSELLRSLDGNVQMMVRAFDANEAILRDVLAADPSLAQEAAALKSLPEPEAHAARVELGERLANAVETRRGEVEAALVDQLSPLAVDVQLDPPHSERVVTTTQLLIRREDRPALDERVRALGEALTGLMTFRYVGPLPPYSFTAMSLDADGG